MDGMTELPAPSAPHARPQNAWRVLAWITLVVCGAVAAVCWQISISGYLAANSGPQTDRGLAYLVAVVGPGFAAVCLTAVALLALISVIIRRKSWIIAAIVVGLLLVVPAVLAPALATLL
jgi:hypothetical protein